MWWWCGGGRGARTQTREVSVVVYAHVATDRAERWEGTIADRCEADVVVDDESAGDRVQLSEEA